MDRGGRGKADAEERADPPGPGGIAFGPVPSRRFGRSLGVNNIPPKHCSYSCVYCQVGRTRSPELDRRSFHPPGQVTAAVERRVAGCRASGQAIDYLTFVPDGEPTLDLHLGEEIRGLDALGIPVAVITNGALLWRPDVRGDLAGADVVSVKVDAVRERPWRRVCRPSAALDLPSVLAGIQRFAAERRGALFTETMLVRGLNDDPAGLEAVAAFLETLAPDVAYLAVPTRPPVEPEVRAPSEAAVVAAYERLASRLRRVELLTGDAEGSFGRAGDPVEDLLGILAVHPLPEPVARRYLEDNGGAPSGVEALLASRRIARVEHVGRVFLVRGFRSARADDPPRPAHS
jgi:wyosine [tRNA(Phe)-imidazoG37] synthetase (radical SAM superfamily)